MAWGRNKKTLTSGPAHLDRVRLRGWDSRIPPPPALPPPPPKRWLKKTGDMTQCRSIFALEMFLLYNSSTQYFVVGIRHSSFFFSVSAYGTVG